MGWLQLEVVTMALLEAGRAWLNPSPKQLHCHRGLAQLSAVQLRWKSKSALLSVTSVLRGKRTSCTSGTVPVWQTFI